MVHIYHPTIEFNPSLAKKIAGGSTDFIGLPRQIG